MALAAPRPSASVIARFFTSSMMVLRWRNSTRRAAAMMIGTINRFAARMNLTWSVSFFFRRLPVNMGSRLLVQPDILHGDIRVSEGTHFDALHVGLEDPLVTVIPQEENGSFIEDLPFGLPEVVDAPNLVWLSRGPREQVVYSGALKTGEVVDTLGVK